MTMKPCRECGQPVGGGCAVCPHCGASRPRLENISPKTAVWIVVAIFGTITVLSLLSRFLQ
jgi:hypothetical protein